MRFRAIVARNVRRLRQRKGWTQVQMAELLDRHKQTVWAIEAGRLGINDRLMDDLADLFEVSYEELIEPSASGKDGTDKAEDRPGARDPSRHRGATYTAEHRPRWGERWSPEDVEQFRSWIQYAAREAALAVLEHDRYPGPSCSAQDASQDSAKPAPTHEPSP